MSATNAHATSVAEVLALYERWGGERYDEDLGQSAHALQTAALARSEGADDALVAAALLHDVGHLLVLAAGGAHDEHRDDGHEDTGAAWLRPLFPTAVTAPIALHVRAKRYLCGVDAAYVRSLSEGSIASLTVQGGPMSAAEVSQFEAMVGHRDAVRLRRWDDLGKTVGLDVPGWDAYEPVLASLANVRTTVSRSIG